MADFLITARITAPDGILAQAQALAKIADPVGVLQKALEEAGFGPVKVEVVRGRALAAPEPVDPDRPKRKRKVKTPAPQGDLGIPPKPQQPEADKRATPAPNYDGMERF